MEHISMDVTHWKDKPTNPNRVINKFSTAGEYLKTAFPGWEFGFFSEEDLEDRRAVEGYIVITAEHFKDIKKEFNSEVAIRYGFREKDGAIWMGDTITCGRPKDWSDRRRRDVQRESEARFALARYGKAAEIKQSIGKGVDVGGSLVETTSNEHPETFTEGSKGEGPEVYTNAESLANEAVATLSKNKGGRPRRTGLGG